MERFFEKITRALVENGNIREEEEEVYQYALKSMLILGGNILLSLMIGVCMGMPGYCVLFLCMLVPLRSQVQICVYIHLPAMLVRLCCLYLQEI